MGKAPPASQASRRGPMAQGNVGLYRGNCALCVHFVGTMKKAYTIKHEV
jgi:hypothetical protein